MTTPLHQKSSSTRQFGALAKLVGAGSAGLLAHNAPASIVSTNLNETSPDAIIYIGFSYTNGVIGTDSFYRVSPFNYGGPIAGVSGYDPAKSWVGSTQAGGNYYKTPSTGNAQITAGALSFGSLIDASSSWAASDTFAQGLSSSYYGVRFSLGSGNYNYGWLQIATPGNGIQFGNAGVETTVNTGITAGAVPEPSTYALLALAGGAGAVMTLRRKKAA
jgi:hypothetical protein